MSEQEIWKKVLEVAESEISKSTFNTFLKDTELKEIRDNVAIIFVIHEFYAEWLNSNYKEVIQTIMKDVIGYEVEPKFFTAEQLAELDETSRKSNTPSEPQRQIIEYGHEGTDQFNTHNTFDTFVIGPGNRFPHAASLAVAEAPAQAYNPLFIYGGVGLGKTHLMHAIGHHVLSNQPNAKVLYTSSEKFTNDFIKSIRNNEPEAFREKYRNIDVLLIDDIQFIQNKEQTQEEFFHTFNELHQNKKQIVISSDRPPKEIPAEALNYIANQIQSNIRELEGALTRLLAYSKLQGRPITTELAAEALKDIIQVPKSKKITIQDIQKVVGHYYNVRIEDFSAKKRTKSIAYPRQIAMYLSRELTDFSLPKIGEEFGGRDHTTVIHAHEKIAKDIKADTIFKQEVEDLEKEIRNQ